MTDYLFPFNTAYTACVLPPSFTLVIVHCTLHVYLYPWLYFQLILFLTQSTYTIWLVATQHYFLDTASLVMVYGLCPIFSSIEQGDPNRIPRGQVTERSWPSAEFWPWVTNSGDLGWGPGNDRVVCCFLISRTYMGSLALKIFRWLLEIALQPFIDSEFLILLLKWSNPAMSVRAKITRSCEVMWSQHSFSLEPSPSLRVQRWRKKSEDIQAHLNHTQRGCENFLRPGNMSLVWNCAF